MQKRTSEPRTMTRHLIAALAGVLALTTLPHTALAQVEELVGVAASLATFASRFAKDSPTGLRSPGEHGVTRVWPAAGMIPTPRPQACFAIPISPPPRSIGACGMSAQQLL